MREQAVTAGREERLVHHFDRRCAVPVDALYPTPSGGGHLTVGGERGDRCPSLSGSSAGRTANRFGFSQPPCDPLGPFRIGNSPMNLGCYLDFV